MFVLVCIPACARVLLEGRERPKVSAGRPRGNPWLHANYSTFGQAHMKNQAAAEAAGLSMRKQHEYQTRSLGYEPIFAVCFKNKTRVWLTTIL